MKDLKFGRTIYVPYNRLIIISGRNNGKETNLVNDVFQFNLLNKEVSKLASIRIPRVSFAAHYDFNDKFIYVIGGSSHQGEMIRECEKYHVFEDKWIEMPQMKERRANPGTVVSNDKRYLYVFEGFVNEV